MAEEEKEIQKEATNLEAKQEDKKQPDATEKVEKKADAPEAPKGEEKPAEATAEKKQDAGVTKTNESQAKGRGRRPFQQGAVTSDKSDESEFFEKVLNVKRITKVTKGGKKLSFSALVVVGDMKGKVGYSLSKAGEVSVAIRKAMTRAKKNMVAVRMKESTIPHEIIGACCGSRVLLKPASEGTGVIAAGPVRAVCDGAGIHNILTKCHRSNNPVNVVKATLDGLLRLKG